MTMNSTRRTIVLIACLTLALPVVAAEEASVGSFVQRLAEAKNLDAADAEIAAASLRGAGISIPADLRLTETLTEGDVARISRTLGLDVSTNRPDAVFSSRQVEQFFSAFRVGEALRGELTLASDPYPGEAGATSPAFDPYLKGRGGSKGKKKGHGFTPTEPE